MASLLVGVLPKTVPTPVPANFLSLFSDASKDPKGGIWDALMTSLLHDSHKSNANTDTITLR